MTCFRFRHRSCNTLDCFRDAHTVLRQVRTSHGSAPKRCRLLSFKNWTVLNCFCLDCTQFHSRSLDNVALDESKIFQYWETCFWPASISINPPLITPTDLCNTPSLSNFSCNTFSNDLNLIFCCCCHKTISMTESIHKL